MSAPYVPSGWWMEADPGGEIRIWRADGLVVAKSYAPSDTDRQAGVDYILGFRAQVPLLYRRKGEAAYVEGETPEIVCARADALWPPVPGFKPTTGMTVWYQRAVYAIVAATVTRFPTHPALRGQEVWRISLSPVDAVPDRAARAHTTEVRTDMWPRGWLILDTGGSAL